MIKSVTVTNYLGDAIILELGKPDKVGLAIKSIDGLGPVKGSINTTEIATDDGSVWNSSRLSERNIVISLAFLWIPLIEDARHLAYKYFPVKRTVHLVIETDRRIVETEGYVESNEPNIFSSSEGASISIICPDPNLYAYGLDGEVTTNLYSITPLFEFPFENDSLTQPKLEFGNSEEAAIRTINYEGEAEVGMKIHIYNNASYYYDDEVENIHLVNLRTNEEIIILTDKLEEMGHRFGKGDEIVISTIKGEKSAKLISNARSINILNALDKSSELFQLAKGPNRIFFEADKGRDNIHIIVENRIAYAGV